MDDVQDKVQVGHVLLPSTHKGGPWYMQLLQDSFSHVLIFLEEPDKICDVDQVDAIISAQIPDP